LRVDQSPARLDLRILSVDGNTLVLAPAPGQDTNGDWQRAIHVGLAFDGGYAQLDRTIERTRDGVRREFTPVKGAPHAGAAARTDSFFYPDDPKQALGVDFSDVAIPGPAGALPAWFVPGRLSTWV